MLKKSVINSLGYISSNFGDSESTKITNKHADALQ